MTYRNPLCLLAIVFFIGACKNDKIVSNQTPSTISNDAASIQNATAVQTTESVKPLQSQNVTDATISSLKTKTTSIVFEKMSYDWGELKEGDKMTHIFKFKNVGVEDLIISDVRPSCGCTTPEWPKEPTKPNTENEIKVVFDSNHKSGDVIKTISVTANTEPTVTVLTIKGKVNSKLNSIPNE